MCIKTTSLAVAVQNMKRLEFEESNQDIPQEPFVVVAGEILQTHEVTRRR